MGRQVIRIWRAPNSAPALRAAKKIGQMQEVYRFLHEDVKSPLLTVAIAGHRSLSNSASVLTPNDRARAEPRRPLRRTAPSRATGPHKGVTTRFNVSVSPHSRARAAAINDSAPVN